MTRATLKKIGIGVAALSGAVVASVFLFVAHAYSSNEQGLREGVDFLLRHELELRYRIERESLEPDSFDPAGDWWIVLEGDPAELRAKLEKHGFGANRESDRAYNVFAARTKFGFHTVAEEARSFAAELTLGEASCCSSAGFGCNIVVVFKDGDPNVFVKIWRI